ncbi:MAG: hypothetical protein ABR532_08915, partial [Candidatus Dormibacteria bacterium]
MRFRLPLGSVPLWRPFQVVFAPPDDAGSAPSLIPEDLTTLDPKALAKLEGELLKQGKRLSDSSASAESVSQLRDVVDALQKVRGEVTRREEESATHEAEKAELVAILNPPEPVAETDPEAPEEPAEDEGEEEPEEAPKAPEPPKVEQIAA